MTTLIKIRTITIKTLLLLLVMNIGFARANARVPTPKAYERVQTVAIQEKSTETITISGLVTAITWGKDGYTANVQLNDGISFYAALVSSANLLGGPDKYKSCEVGDDVTFTGELSVSGKAKRLMVREIISITAIINGIVKTITRGKDGYIAQVQTDTRGTYAALVSSANLLGGPDAYKQCKVGDYVCFKGEPSVSRTTKSLMVREIIDIAVPQSVWSLIAEYRAIKPDDNCYQTNHAMELRTSPSASSKALGKHFAGEYLQVLKTKMVGEQLWVKVTYQYTIKGGYEDRFADGQVTRGGEATGWIGGAESPEIRCR
jgi:hypothetical protein